MKREWIFIFLAVFLFGISFFDSAFNLTGNIIRVENNCLRGGFAMGELPGQIIEFGNCFMEEDDFAYLENNLFDIVKINYLGGNIFVEMKVGTDEYVYNKNYFIDLEDNFIGDYYSLNIQILNITLEKVNFSYELTIDPCSDSDDGENLDVFGIVEWGGDSREDSCFDEYTVEEWFCDNPIILLTGIIGPFKENQYVCEDKCEGGVCVEDTIASSCTDSDGGLNYSVGGYVVGSEGTFYDDCIDILI